MSDPPGDVEPDSDPDLDSGAGEPLVFGADEELPSDPGDRPIRLPQPNISQERFAIWKARKQLKKRQKLLDEGYVEWYLIDDSFPRPMYVQPNNNGGVPQYRHEGQTYLFPRPGALPDQSSGMWTFVHRRGFADPVNLRDPDEYALPADVLDEYLSLTVSSSPPSFFDKFDVDGQTLLYGAIAAVLLLGTIWQFMGGAA